MIVNINWMLYVELVNILLSCGVALKEAITRSVRLQCEQNWGALCDSLSFCSPGPPEGHLHPSRMPDPEHHHRGVPRHPVFPSPWPEEKDKAKKGGPALPFDVGHAAWLSSPEATLADGKTPDFRR
ncbi:stanniocalcin-2-like isoform X1 [Arapaima gigas]